MAGYRGLVLAGGVVVSLALGAGSEAQAATCGVEQAANAALQRRLAVIDAAKVNPSEFFTGANSCIDANLLKSFDLSAMIPDLAGFLSGGIQNIAQQAINAAKQKACEVLNEQINGVIGKINDTTSSFNSGLSGELSGILGSSFSITKPNTSGYGSYDLSSLGNDFNFDGLSNAVNQVGTNIPTTFSEGSSSAISTLGSSSQAPATTGGSNTSSGGASWLSD